MALAVKRAFKYRFYPNDEQASELARTFGCVRLVYNMALAARSEGWRLRQERINYNATSALLTDWKKTEELVFLNEVSSVPLQQALRHLQSAFINFWAKRAKYPTFKSKKRSRRSAEYTTSAFRYRDGRLTLAKMAEPLNIVWSRPLPESSAPSTRRPSFARTAAFSPSGCHLAPGYGPADAARCMIGTSMRRATYFPPGWRSLPVKAV